MTPVVIAARICGHHVLTCGSESRTAALNTVHMSIATTWTPARHWRVWAPIHADTLAAVRPDPGGWTHPLSAQADIAALTTLFQPIGEFFTTREQPNGLSRIFRTYRP